MLKIVLKNVIKSVIILVNLLNISQYSYSYNINPVRVDISKITFKNPEHVIGYLSSLSEYTIISVGDKNNEFNETLHNCTMMGMTYFANLEGIVDDNCRDKTCDYIRFKYRNVESGEDLWFFHRGFHIGGRNEFYKFINRRRLKDI